MVRTGGRDYSMEFLGTGIPGTMPVLLHEVAQSQDTIVTHATYLAPATRWFAVDDALIPGVRGEVTLLRRPADTFPGSARLR